MFDLFCKEEKDLRVAWLVECDNRFVFLTRSGIGCRYLEEKYKKTEYTATAIPKKLFEEIKNKIAFVFDLAETKQAKLF